MSEPKRIQRKRTKGWRMPEGAVYVGRPTRWGNPYRPGDLVMVGKQFAYPVPTDLPLGKVGRHPAWVTECMDLGEAVSWYALWAGVRVEALGAEFFADLAGRDLACWCPLDQPCHADVLLKIANADGGAA